MLCGDEGGGGGRGGGAAVLMLGGSIAVGDLGLGRRGDPERLRERAQVPQFTVVPVDELSASRACMLCFVRFGGEAGCVRL